MSSLPDPTDVGIRSATPPLISSEGLDAATPTFYSEVVQESLSNARFAVFPEGTHVQLGVANALLAQIMAALIRHSVAAQPK